MDAGEASALLSRAVGVDVGQVEVRRMCRLWGGMGDVLELRAASRVAVAKRIRMPRDCSSIGDQRKKDSYEVEVKLDPKPMYGRTHTLYGMSKWGPQERTHGEAPERLPTRRHTFADAAHPAAVFSRPTFTSAGTPIASWPPAAPCRVPCWSIARGTAR